MNSKANLITLPLIQVETHTTWLSQLEQEVSIIGLPSNYIKKKGINLWFKVPKIYFRNTLMCVRSTLCNVQLPVEWKFLGKRFGFLSFPLSHQFILIFKRHPENVQLNWLHFSNLWLLESCLVPKIFGDFFSPFPPKAEPGTRLIRSCLPLPPCVTPEKVLKVWK